jgi:PiT family inorganic phosphate transporter
VSSSVVGVGAARRKKHVDWLIVRDILLAWVVTMPCCALIAAIVCLVGKAMT